MHAELTVAVLRETEPGERRVALTPDGVGRLRAEGMSILVEDGAGAAAWFPDTLYLQAGADVVRRYDALRRADVVLAVRRPPPEELHRGQVVIGLLAGADYPDLADRGVTAVSLEGLPRTLTRAQSMDALSSQDNVAGYKAVLLAASTFARYVPMLITPAGTVRPAKVLVLGVGVAGLQAIGTARRLGAVVSAYDIRPETEAEVHSLGASFLPMSPIPTGTGVDGYARALTAVEEQTQRRELGGHIAKQDIVITTALIPGRPAPRLISDAQVASMRPGSVIVDLAVEQGGNVEGSVAGEMAERHGVRIVGHRNVPSRLAADASALYARNVYNFLSAFWDKEAGRVVLPDDDEIVRGVRLTQGGQVVSERLKG